jgi:hypothetical protein
MSVVRFTAACPACGEDALWTQRADYATQGTVDIDCPCRIEAGDAVGMAVQFLRQGLPPRVALRCLMNAA